MSHWITSFTLVEHGGMLLPFIVIVKSQIVVPARPRHSIAAMSLTIVNVRAGVLMITCAFAPVCLCRSVGGTMVDLLTQIETFLTEYRAVATVIGSPLVALLAGKLFLMLVAVFKLRRVHQIVSADDPALGDVEDIQRIRFPIEERDPEGLLSQKIAASEFNMLGKPHSNAAMIVLYYKVGGKILAYLTAEHFRSERIIFFWYIAKGAETPNAGSDERTERGPAESEVATDLVSKLIHICNGYGGWDHVIAEVDSRDPHEAVMRLRRFQQYAWHLRFSKFDHPLRWLLQRPPLRWIIPRKPPAPSVFKVDLPFKMPLHEAGFLFEAEKHETPAWLVVAPRENEKVETVGGRHVMPREKVVALLDALRRSYEDPDEPEYSAYIATFYDTIAETVPDPSRLICRGPELAVDRAAPRAAGNVVLGRPRPA